MSESVTLLPLPKDIKIGVGAAFIKAHGGMLLQTAPNTNLIANDDLEEEEWLYSGQAWSGQGHQCGQWHGTRLVITVSEDLAVALTDCQTLV